MKIDIVLNEQDLRRLVLEHLRLKLGEVELQEKDVIIEVMSTHIRPNGRRYTDPQI
jgi:hypothetical protein